MIDAKNFDHDRAGTSNGKLLLDIDAARFAERFDRAPFLIGHHLCDHPLFEIGRILELARRLPEAKVEYNAGQMPRGVDPSETPRNGLSADETIRRIEECKSWMVLKNVEVDPEYSRLLEACLAEVAVHSEPMRPGMCVPEAFVFLSSPNSITPYHIDPEHNFLLQISGEKRVTVFDRGLVTSEQLERFYGGAHRNIPYKEAFEQHAETIDLSPGKGMHIPVTAPHCVENGRGVSVSFSITFRTPELDRTKDAHVVNAGLRRAGVRPALVGTSIARDSVKSLTRRGWRKSLRVLGLGNRG